MNVNELINIIKDILQEDLKLNTDSELIGGSSSIDSMNLVQICLALEEKSSEEGFEFDWTSEKAMSSINSIFKSPQTLTNEYNRQKNKA
jgi:acyl carrier protein